MWRESYDAALAEHIATPLGATCAAEKLLHAVLSKVDSDDKNVEDVKAQVSAVGRELTTPLSELTAIAKTTPRHDKLGALQLQVVCRLLWCCGEGVFDASETADEPTKRMRVSKSKKSHRKLTKKHRKADVNAKPNTRSELRELLDRIALMLDSANPPSIAESEDEPSPFHHFLLHVLEKPLGKFIPQVFKVLRDDYELTEEEPEPINRSHATARYAAKATPLVKEQQASRPSSILSALKDERPSNKRPRSAVSDAFQRVHLPGQLHKAAPRSSSARGRDASALRMQELSGSRSSTSAPPTSSKTAKRSAAADASTLSLTSLAAASKKSKTTKPLKPVMMPLLVRNVDRQLLPKRNSAVDGRAARPVSAAASALASRFGPTRPTPPALSNLSKNSMVLRTPDRPQRVQRTQPRVLVAASPPLRNPFAAARNRKPGSQLPQ